MLPSPEVIDLPAHCPNKTLSVAPEKLHPEQVLDANKLRSLSAENPASIPVKPAPHPKKQVAVTELIPDIFVAVSPMIFPFAVIFPVKVEAPPTVTSVLIATLLAFKFKSP